MKINLDKWQGFGLLFDMVEKDSPTFEGLYDAISANLSDAAPYFVKANLLPPDIEKPEFRKLYLDELVRQYRISRGVVLRKGKIFGARDHQPWVDAELEAGRLSFDGYDLYSRLVLGSQMKLSAENVRQIDGITSSILDYMGNPRSGEAYKTYGLLMGEVQSGKTAIFTGICHKAVDAGYRLLIVLTGTKSSLRKQTQDRLNRDLMGFQNDSKGTHKSSGLGKGVDWNQLTSSTNDFIASKVEENVPAPDRLNQVSIAVVQKNSSVLNNIIKWIDNAEALGIRHVPLLMVDDEADAASINVNKDEDSPTAINNKIRLILEKFDRAAYLAVTATPFANVFIDPQLGGEGELRQDVLPDLFPRDYIYAIPTPKGYVGVQQLFGDYSDLMESVPKSRNLIELSAGEDAVGDRVNSGKLRAKDRIHELPASLRKAVLYFLCCCTLKDICEAAASNTSMLVHIARYKSLQHDLWDLIEDLVERVVRLGEVEGARMTPELRANPLFGELKSIWNDGLGDERWYDDPTRGKRPPTLKELSGFAWEDVWKRRFQDVIKTVQVVEVNTNNDIKDFKVYYEKQDGRIIAVGGDALSRGLTLEGLCVSYFSRRALAYDTLLQMGRWFGYRMPMLDYMKIWISDCQVAAYGYVAEALEEFRDTLDLMRRQKQTPSEFGLRIRRAPKNVKLMVTAANKRRHAKRIRAVVDITGFPIQGSSFPKSREDREKNVRLTAEFLKKLGEMTPDGQKGTDADLVWNDAPNEVVADFLQTFKVPVWGSDYDIASVIKRIRDVKENWMVRVISVSDHAGEAPADVFGLGDDYKVLVSTRTIFEKSGWLIPNQRAVLSPSHFARHWTDAQRKEVLEKQQGDYKQVLPFMVLTHPGEKPQLLIYPIRPQDVFSEEQRKRYEASESRIFRSDEVLVGLVFGIPSTGKKAADEVYVEYDINRIGQLQREEGFDEGDGEQ